MCLYPPFVVWSLHAYHIYSVIECGIMCVCVCVLGAQQTNWVTPESHTEDANLQEFAPSCYCLRTPPLVYRMAGRSQQYAIWRWQCTHSSGGYRGDAPRRFGFIYPFAFNGFLIVCVWYAKPLGNQFIDRIVVKESEYKTSFLIAQRHWKS